MDAASKHEETGSRLAFVVIAAFLVLEFIYAFRLPRVMDEFTGARYAWLSVTSMPYRDFAPPKPVVAYYIEALPLLFVSDHWNGMTAIRIELALLWAAAFAVAVHALSKWVAPKPLAAALAVSLFMSTFAERCLEIRPDAVAAMLGLLSLVALIRRRPALAGVLVAASFCAIQKGIYFALAGGLALVALVLRDRTRAAFGDALRYAAASFACVAAYFAFWSALVSADTVFGRVLFDKHIRAAALSDLYGSIRSHFWTQTVVRNPLFYAAAAVALIALAAAWRRRDPAIDIVAPYGLVVAAGCLWHKQPWPYFFVFLIPTLFVVLAIWFNRVRCNRALASTFVAVAVLIPLARLPITLTRGETAYQHAMVDAAQLLLPKGDTYLDGMNMLYRHNQASPEFTWIDAKLLQQFATLPPADIRRSLAMIDAGRPRVAIWSYRLAQLPPAVRDHLLERFRPVYGDVLLYAPVIRGTRVSLDFDGDYMPTAPVTIDGTPVRGSVALRRGAHTVAADQPARLALLPPQGLLVDPRYAAMKPLFVGIYDY